VGSPRGTGKLYLCIAGLHRGIVGKVDSVRHKLGRGKCPYNNWSVIIQSTGDGLWGSDIIIGVRGLSGVRESLEDLLEVHGGERGCQQVLMRRGGIGANDVFNCRRSRR
jgi:hypothetical protein